MLHDFLWSLARQLDDLIEAGVGGHKLSIVVEFQIDVLAIILHYELLQVKIVEQVLLVLWRIRFLHLGGLFCRCLLALGLC